MSVLINTGSCSTFKVSDSRITAIVSGDKEKTLHLGLWDRIKDCFKKNEEKKSEILNCLYELCHPQSEGTEGIKAEESVRVFERLQSLAQEEHRSQFQLSLSNLRDGSRINFFIGDHLITSQPVQPEERSRIARKLGINDTNDQSMIQSQTDCLSTHLIDPDISKDLSDASFETGGLHKRFAMGILRAQDESGSRDFTHEARLGEYASDKDDLKHFISLQKSIPVPEGLSDRYTYARVPCYDNQVISTELDHELKKLQPHESELIALQLVDMLHVFYKNQVSHRDMHMHNLMIRRINDSDSQKILLQAFDFGKSKFDNAFPDNAFTDINYIFNKQACNYAETVKRNHLRDPASEKQQKHYPLHKLLSQGGFPEKEVSAYLADIGVKLVNDLKNAPSPQTVDTAFKDASDEVKRLFSPRAILNAIKS